MQSFQAEISQSGDGQVLWLAGEIDLGVVAGLREALTRALDQADGRLTVDLSGVDFMDSTGLNTLVAAYRQMQERRGELVLRAPTPMIRKVLHISGLSRLATVVDEAPRDGTRP